MTLRFRPFLTAALLALGVASAHAQSQERDDGWFIGAGGGVSKFNDGCSILSGAGTCDDNGSYWKAFGGYRFNPYFGFELGYADFGEVSRTAGATSATFDATGMEIVLVATIPLNRQFSLYGKYGLYRWDVDLTVTGAGSVSATGKDVTYGFGATYNFTKNIAARMEYQKYFDAGDASTGTFNIDAGLVGIVFKF